MRQLALLLAAAVLAIAAPAASAGSFSVTGCSGWSPYNSSPANLAVYGQCPGFAARNIGGAFSTPVGAQAGWSFTAPPGTYLQGINLLGSFLGVNGWQAAGIATGGDAGAGYTFQGCPGATCPGAVSYLGNYPLPPSNTVNLRVRCGTSAGCSNGALGGSIDLSNVIVSLKDFTSPSVRIVGGALAGSGWHSGTQVVTAQADDNSGIAALTALVDGSPRSNQPRPGCDYTLLVPCPNVGGDIAVSTTGLSDGMHSLSVQAVDGSGNAADQTMNIYVDNTPPAAPIAPTLVGGDAWQASNAFHLQWTDPAQSAAPITSVWYRVCPTGQPTSAECIVAHDARTPGSGANLTDVPSPGDWDALIWLGDAAGNATPTNGGLVEHLRYDPTPPSVSIAPPDPANPTTIHVLASDDTSGLASGDVEVQRTGETVWHTLPTTPVSDGFVATIDDSQFPDGTYTIRAHAVDQAGNERTSDTLSTGSAAALTLPLRMKTRLAVGQLHRVRAHSSRRGGKPHYRRVLVGKPRSRYGRTVLLHGRLTTPGANPLATVPVEVWELSEAPGSVWTHLATINTSRTGRFTFRALRGPSRIVQFRYGGTATVRPRVSTVEMLVQGSTSLDVDRHHVVNGDDVVFHGHVRGRPLPPQGKLVELQVYTRYRWRTFAQPRADAANGRWSFRYRFEAVRGLEPFRFRARVRKEQGYPYELGTSRHVKVSVRGL